MQCKIQNKTLTASGHQRRFECAPAISALPPISDGLLSRSKGAGVFMRAIGAMIAPLSDHWRWGINAGASLGHHHARDYRRPMWAPGSTQPRRRRAAPAQCPLICGRLASSAPCGRHALPSSAYGDDRRSSSCSLAKFTAICRASSCVSRFGRRAMRRSDMSEIGGEAEVRGLRLKRRVDDLACVKTQKF